jgi:eukaryotic-like serine/threonine-protein kinase
LIGQTLSHYRVTAAIGTGGMGEVYRATDTTLGRDVAIKVLPSEVAQDPERLARFQREAHLLASLNHPNIAAIYGLEESAGKPFLALELVEGEDLKERLARGAIPVDEALEIAKQVAEALEEAHDKGIVHRDLKPANVKITPEGKVKVLDFGLAKACAGAAASGSGPDLSRSPTLAHTGTQAGIILGTAAYMSPEQARGKPVDKRADIWAFGVVLYEMLAGRQLFAGETVSDVLAAVLKTGIDFSALPAGTPPAVRQLLRRCLERSSRDRLRDIGEARVALAWAPEDAAVAAREAVPAAARRTALALGFAAVAFALLFLAALLRPRAGVTLERHLARFPLVTDPSLSVFTDLTTPLAVSPDGQTVVFTATKEGKARHLWVRSLGSLDARELTDTEDSTQPAISPDGQWVAFVVGFNEIKKVRLSGGPATHLAKIGGYTAWLTWASNDEIFFEVLDAKPGTKAGIHRLSAAGGEPEELIPLDSATGETGARRPFVIRGEGRVVYASETGADRHSTLAMFSLGDLRRARLGVDGVQALGMVDGHLVYAQANGNLMAVPLDVSAMRVTGPTIDLGERVASSAVGTRVMLSDAGTLVSLPSAIASRLMLVDLSGSSRALGTETGPFVLPRYSPDGRRIVVGSGSAHWAMAEPGHLDLWLFDRDSGQASRLTRTGLAWAPSWSPDGRRILYTQVASDGTNPEIWALPLDGSAEASRLLLTDASLGPAEMAPDGRSLVAVAFLSDGRQSLVRATLGASPTVTDLFPASSRASLYSPTSQRISPDGRLLAFAEGNFGEVYVRPLDGAGLLQVTDKGGTSPAWGPDSRHLYFGQGNVLTVAELRTSPTLAVVDRHVVAQLPYTCEDFDVAPDGKSFVVVAPESGQSEVIVSLHWTDEVRRRLRAASSSSATTTPRRGLPPYRSARRVRGVQLCGTARRGATVPFGRAYRVPEDGDGPGGWASLRPEDEGRRGADPGQRAIRGSLPLGRHAPAVPVLGRAEQLPRRRRPATSGLLSPRWSRMFPIATWSVTNGMRLMRWPHRPTTSPSIR